MLRVRGMQLDRYALGAHGPLQDNGVLGRRDERRRVGDAGHPLQAGPGSVVQVERDRVTRWGVLESGGFQLRGALEQVSRRHRERQAWGPARRGLPTQLLALREGGKIHRLFILLHHGGAPALDPGAAAWLGRFTIWLEKMLRRRGRLSRGRFLPRRVMDFGDDGGDGSRSLLQLFEVQGFLR